LRLAFVALLYLFLANLVGAIRRDLSRPSAPPAASSWRGAQQAPPGRLIVLDGGSSGLQSGRSLVLADETTIGRSPGSAVRLTGPFVSAQHAVLRWNDGRWYLEDLQSTNGTLLNGAPVERVEALEFGDLIEIGNVQLKLAP
jgi:pSer/pThr/pTyr-binding forkhead associated (FHA) protein